MADNSGGIIVTTTYSYNRRRLMTRERMQFGSTDWSIDYGYNANGHLASNSYPVGGNFSYAPNALGQPTRVANFATGASYHPNGALKQFTYGNGIVHTLTQNTRGLPDRSRDVYGSTRFLDDGYDYDANGNVAAISDGATGQNGRGNRDMFYDGLDRLIRVKSPVFGSGSQQSAHYDYDALDNLTGVVISGSPARLHAYCYNSRNQLTSIRNNFTGQGCSGSTITSLSYDNRGNLSLKGGQQSFDFDYGNRLRLLMGTGIQSYQYDGHGRRVRDWNSGGSKLSVYSADGKLRYVDDQRTGGIRSSYFYLGNSLVAIRERNSSNTVLGDKYQHTDALGSPVAVTGASRQVLARYEYEPYGQVLGATPPDGPGYTGHVFDAATGLNYMQQRYYDPQIGRFISTDPVGANPQTGANFNRYWYANNNPYTFIDPDGRDVVIELHGFRIGRFPIQGDYGHQYVYLRDTDSGAEMISRAGPSEAYPGGLGGVLSGSPVQNQTGDGNVTLVTELKSASESIESNPITGRPLGSAIQGTQVTIPGNIEQATAKLQRFNDKVDAANIDYRPRSTNSNAYAGTAYSDLTGKAAPALKEYPGSKVNLKEYIDEPR